MHIVMRDKEMETLLEKQAKIKTKKKKNKIYKMSLKINFLFLKMLFRKSTRGEA